VEERLSADELLAIAREAGFEVLPRRLEDWRYRSLFPHPERVPSRGKKPLWLYPTGSDRWLLDLCGWRALTKNMEAIRVALWVDGHLIDTDAVRESISAALEELQRRFERALRDEASRGGDTGDTPVTVEEALDSLAYRAAGVKGDRPAPRTIRMTRADRARGIAFLARMFMGYDLEERLTDAKQAERAMGIAAGRRGPAAYRWLDGPPEDIADLRSVIALPVLIQSAQAATNNELERARTLARAFVQGLPIVALFAEAMFGPRAAGLAGVKNIVDPPPELYSLLVAGLVSAIWQGSEENNNTLEEALDNINQLAPTINELATLTPTERRQRVEQAPPTERPQVRRLLELASEQRTKSTQRKRT
jgi:hypothetical protein